MSTNTPEDPKENARQRGYKAASLWHTQQNTSIPDLREYAATDTLPGPFRDGWLQYCDEQDRADYQRRNPTHARERQGKARSVMERIIVIGMLMAVLAVAYLYGSAYFTRQMDKHIEAQRAEDLATATRWLGTIETQRTWAVPVPGRPGQWQDNTLQLHNRDVEIGLRADGTVVWRKAGPTPKSK